MRWESKSYLAKMEFDQKLTHIVQVKKMLFPIHFADASTAESAMHSIPFYDHINLRLGGRGGGL
jgi:hypothetical protein